MLTFRAFSQLNRQRSESPSGFGHALNSWSLSDWMTATLGELGEAANIAKKLNRCRDGVRGNDKPEVDLRAALRTEFADIFCYLDMMVQSQGWTLEEIVPEKFNEASRRMGCPILCPEFFDEECHQCGGSGFIQKVGPRHDADKNGVEKCNCCGGEGRVVRHSPPIVLEELD